MARFSNDVASPHYNGIRLQNNPVDLDAIAQQNNYASFAAWQEADPIGASLAERQNGAQGSYQQAALHDDPDWLKQGLIIGGTVGGGALADWAMGGGLAGAGGAGATGGGGGAAAGGGGAAAAAPSLGVTGTVGLPAGVGLPGTLAGAPIAAGAGTAGAATGGIVSTTPFAGSGGAMAGGAVTPGIVSTTPVAGTAFGSTAGVGAGAGTAAGAAGAVGTGAELASGAGDAAASYGAPSDLAHGTGILGGTGPSAEEVANSANAAGGGGASNASKILSGAKTAGNILETAGVGLGGAAANAAKNRGAENLFNVDLARQASLDYAVNARAQDDFHNELVNRQKIEATARETEAGNIYRDSVLHNPTFSPLNARPQTFSPGLIKTYDNLAEQGSTDLAQRPVYDPRTMTAPTYTPYNRPLPTFKQPGTLENVGGTLSPILTTIGTALAKRYLS